MAEKGGGGVSESIADTLTDDIDEVTGDEVSSPESTQDKDIHPERYKQIEGFDGRKNDVIYCPPLDPTSREEIKVAVYFGGDIQDFPELMDLHRDHCQRSNKYNLESTAVMLRKQFPRHRILVIRPRQILHQTFSCFDNFVPCRTDRGVPEHTPNNNALVHLKLLLKNLFAKIDGRLKNPGLDEWDITLIGFSKGTVVLNQFLYEFHYLKTLTPDDDSMDFFLSQISNMYWLDGGHSGGNNTYMTFRSMLESLTRLNIRIHVHMTPYRLRDERRGYIAREEKIFSDSLISYGAWLRRYVHFENENSTLDVHFKILEEFKNVEPEEEDVGDNYVGPSESKMMRERPSTSKSGVGVLELILTEEKISPAVSSVLPLPDKSTEEGGNDWKLRPSTQVKVVLERLEDLSTRDEKNRSKSGKLPRRSLRSRSKSGNKDS